MDPEGATRGAITSISINSLILRFLFQVHYCHQLTAQQLEKYDQISHLNSQHVSESSGCISALNQKPENYISIPLVQ